MEIIENLNRAEKFVKSKSTFAPRLGLVLGSGLGDIVEIISDKTIIPYGDIPNFPVSTVHGHAGQLVFGRLDSKNIVVMQGRVHYYEGHTMESVIFPVRLMKKLGVEKLILTSAVGAMNKGYKPADLVLIYDHINLMDRNPLIGPHYKEFGERFPDMSTVYSGSMLKKAETLAKKLGIRVHRGVYLALSGPSYETPSEIKAYRILGGDVVGMSVVPESIAANQSKIEVLCISYISNMASGVSKRKTALTHEEVIKVGKTAGKKVSKVIKELIPLI